MVVMVDDEAPVSGRWLVDTIDVDPLKVNVADVTLRRRGAKKLEPAPEIRTREAKWTGRTIGGKSAYAKPGDPSFIGPTRGERVKAVYDEAVRISRQGRPYGPAGHVGSWAAAKAAPSQDCSSSTSLALHAAGMMKGVSAPQVSDWLLNWGEPGAGKTMTVWVKRGTGAYGHVWIQFRGVGRWVRFDTGGPGGGRGARVSTENRGDTLSFILRHWPGT